MTVIANKPKVGDVGTLIRIDMQQAVDTAIPHSAETSKGIIIIVDKPDGSSEEWINCTPNGRYIEYVTSADELNVASRDWDNNPYLLTPKFGMSGWEGTGDTAQMYVYAVGETE
jgi:hypothetical protein